MEGESREEPDRRKSLGKDREDRENHELWALCLGIHLGCMPVTQGVWEWRDNDPGQRLSQD